MPDHDEQFARMADYYRLRNLVKPGITGLAQVRGLRGFVNHQDDIVKRTDSDLFYLENWSLLLDTRIILRTLLTIFRAPSSAV